MSLEDKVLDTAEEHYPTILLIGNNPAVRESILLPLQQMRMKIIVTNEGLHGLTLLAEESPSVVLLNKRLPQQDGYHLCQIIRKNLHYQTLPILLLLPEQNAFDSMRARLAGVSAYFRVPEEAEKVIQEVRNYLKD